jgi:PAS domain S-box-containing protein
VDVVEADGSLRQLTSGHADPAKDELLLAMRARYRAAMERGDRPVDGVTHVIASGQALNVVVDAIDESLLEGADEGRLLAELAPSSYLIVPLVAEDAVIGAMTFLATGGRTFAPDDLPVAAELAGRCSQAIRNAQLYDEAVSARVLLDTIFDTAPVGLCLIDTNLRFVLINERMAAINGQSVDAHLGRTLEEQFGPAASTVTDILRGVIARGEAVTDIEILNRGRAFLASYAPVLAEDRVLGVISAVVETTERHRAQAERDRLLERTARLHEVTQRLSGALTKDEVADVILNAGMAATRRRAASSGCAATTRCRSATASGWPAARRRCCRSTWPRRCRPRRGPGVPS